MPVAGELERYTATNLCNVPHLKVAGRNYGEDVGRLFRWLGSSGHDGYQFQRGVKAALDRFSQIMSARSAVFQSDLSRPLSGSQYHQEEKTHGHSHSPSSGGEPGR